MGKANPQVEFNYRFQGIKDNFFDFVVIALIEPFTGRIHFFQNDNCQKYIDMKKADKKNGIKKNNKVPTGFAIVSEAVTNNNSSSS